MKRVLSRGLLPETLTDVVEVRHHAARLDGRFDLLIAHASTIGVGLSSAGIDAPLVFVYHSATARELRTLRPRFPFRSRVTSYGLAPVIGLLERMVVRRSARILLLSEFTRSLFMLDHAAHADRVRLVRGAADVNSFDPGDGLEAARKRLGIDGGATLLVTVRRLDPRMGLDLLLHALRLLNDERPVDLAIIGSGMLEKPLRHLRTELRLEDRVRLLGSVGDDRLRDWYRAADLFVLPSTAFECFGMVTAESLASGTPVVGTRVGATPELLEGLDPRLLVGSPDPQALAETIRCGLELAGPELRSRCREYALAKFNWESQIGVWEAAMTEATGTFVQAPARVTAPRLT